jgi:PKD repeat protein
MRSFHVFALVAGAAVASAACGGGDGNGPSNAAPVAAFTHDCTLLACNFSADPSSDPDAGDAVQAWDWDFGDGSAHGNTKDVSHTYAAAGSFHVKLTVRDSHNAASATADSTITVSDQPPANQPPTAEFGASCSSLDCSFTNQSTDADGSIASFAWDFGDPASGSNNSSTAPNPNHSYTATAPDTFTVRLIATDNAGAADTVTHNVVVAPPAECSGSSCDLTLQADATVTVTLTSEGCSAAGNTLRITAPIDTTLFTDGCNTPAGTSYTLTGPAAGKFTAGSTIVPEVISGSSKLAFPPTLRLRAGTAYPTWVLEFDDGESGAGPGCPGDPTCGGKEPDFDDLVITIQATP